MTGAVGPHPARTVEDHLALVLAAVRPLAPETVPAPRARGRILAAPLRAGVDIPPFDSSAMDGFAVRGDDLRDASPARPRLLEVVADLPAGSRKDPAVALGQAVRIMTGAPVPTDATAVVRHEDTERGPDRWRDTVAVLAPPPPGAHIRRRGEDVKAGDEMLPTGWVVGPLQVAAAAAAGVAEVEVVRLPRLAVVSTGSELVRPGATLHRGDVPESNGALLQGLAESAGGRVVLRATVQDSVPDTAWALTTAEAAGADVLVLSGGVGPGDHDAVRQTLGNVLTVASVAMRPGAHQGFGTTDGGMLVFALPGNPVACAVSFEVFVRPALLAMQGTVSAPPRAVLPAGSGWRGAPAHRHFVPVAVDRTDPARWTVRPVTPDGRGSHRAAALARAEGYAITPPGVERVDAGDLVEVVLTW